MRKILISTSSFNKNNIQSKISDKLKKNKIDIIYNPYKRRLTEDETIGLLRENVIGMIGGVESLTQRVLTAAGQLKVISRCGVGLDNIDLAAAKRLQIKIYNTPDAPTIAVAEFTLALILNLLRNIHQANKMVRLGVWKPLMGNLLFGKTIGVIGFGRIGKNVIRMLEAFGTNVLIYDPNIDMCSQVEDFCSLQKLLVESDIITLHLSYSPENHHFINQERLSQMKSSAILVNTARGDLIDEDSLYQSLKSKKLAGAALDVFSAEPYNGPLITLENVLLTTHMGGYACESRDLMEKQALNNLLKGLEMHEEALWIQ